VPNKIKIEGLENAIASELQRYSSLVQEEFEETKKSTAEELKENIKAASPRSSRKKRKKYAEGWKVKKQRDGYIVHNATNYQLTHLLEKGHAKKNGGRVKAQPHIAPAESKAIDKFLKAIERMVKG
jgi:hypothetical protein